jgi:hypothetical protein
MEINGMSKPHNGQSPKLPDSTPNACVVGRATPIASKLRELSGQVADSRPAPRLVRVCRRCRRNFEIVPLQQRGAA